jgi:hypothetical protein
MNASPLVLVTLLACGSSTSSPQDGGMPPDGAADVLLVPDAAADLAVGLDGPADLDDGHDTLATTAVKFVLRNETGKTIYLQQEGFWTLTREGTRVRPEDTCEVCNCAAAGCAVCGAPLPVVLSVDPGAMQAWEWNGLDWAIVPGGKDLGAGRTINCEEPRAVPAGPLAVQVLYSFTKEGPPDGSHVGPTVAIEQTFQHPPTADVVLVAR